MIFDLNVVHRLSDQSTCGHCVIRLNVSHLPCTRSFSVCHQLRIHVDVYFVCEIEIGSYGNPQPAGGLTRVRVML